ncbi:hypothetical protein PGB90_005002 [Kerria lacca]
MPYGDLPGPSTSALNVVDELCDSIEERVQKSRRDREKSPRKQSRNSTSFLCHVIRVFFRTGRGFFHFLEAFAGRDKSPRLLGTSVLRTTAPSITVGDELFSSHQGLVPLPDGKK